MTDHLKPGRLAGQNLSLLEPGRSVLRQEMGTIGVFTEAKAERLRIDGFGGGFCGGPARTFTYIGETDPNDPEKWIVGQWTENPVPGRMISFYADGRRTYGTRVLSDSVKPWSAVDAFRLADEPQATQPPPGEVRTVPVEPTEEERLADLKVRSAKWDEDRRRIVALGGPAESEEATLRAMAHNYAGGHRWDHLDGDAVTRAADEIKNLRTALAAAPQPDPASGVGEAMAWRDEVCERLWLETAAGAKWSPEDVFLHVQEVLCRDALSAPSSVGEGDEPVAWFRQSNANPRDWYQIRDHERAEMVNMGMRVLPLYTRPAPPIRDGWQTMDSAPRDGTVIDVWRAEGGRDTVFWGFPHHDCGEMGGLCDSDAHKVRAPGWVCQTFNEMVGRKHNPFTHWMPLPAAPREMEA